jgi:hypothetical protein
LLLLGFLCDELWSEFYRLSLKQIKRNNNSVSVGFIKHIGESNNDNIRTSDCCCWVFFATSFGLSFIDFL